MAGESFAVDTVALRKVATTLRGHDVLEQLDSAMKKLVCANPTAVFGPTAGPAAKDFLADWRAELTAVVAVVKEVAEALEKTAAEYDHGNQQATGLLRLQQTDRARGRPHPAARRKVR